MARRKKAQQAAEPLTPEIFADHLERVEEQMIETEAANEVAKAENSKLRSLYKAAKAAGIDPATLRTVIAERKEPREAREARIKRELQYQIWAGLPSGHQATLFNDMTDMPEDRADKMTVGAARRKGKKAGMAGHNRQNNPFDAGTECFQAFDSGWCAGQATIIKGNPNKASSPAASEAVTGHGDGPETAGFGDHDDAESVEALVDDEAAVEEDHDDTDDGFLEEADQEVEPELDPAE